MEEEQVFDGETTEQIAQARKTERKEFMRRYAIRALIIIIPVTIFAIFIILVDHFGESLLSIEPGELEEMKRMTPMVIFTNTLAFATIVTIFMTIIWIIKHHYTFPPYRANMQPDTFAKAIIYKYKTYKNVPTVKKDENGKMVPDGHFQYVKLVTPNVDNFLYAPATRPYIHGETVQIEYDSKNPRGCKIIENQAQK